MRSIVRRDGGEGYEEFLRQLAQASGIATPTREELAKLDRQRAKKTSNEDWVNPHDPEAGITKMKDGRTHLAYKAEHAVDLETGAVVAVTVESGDAGDTETMLETLPQAGENIAEVACATNREEVGERVDPAGPAEAVADKGYHSNDTLVALKEAEVRAYNSPRRRNNRFPYSPRIRRRFEYTAACASGLAFHCWNAASRMRMRRAGCGACTCADATTCASEC